jgi:leucyl/phenylalanyl-tRNA--protein transferase
MIRLDQLNQFGSLFSEGIEVEAAPTFEERWAQRQALLDEDFLVTLLRWGVDLGCLASPAMISSLPASLRALAMRDPSVPCSPPDTRFTRPERSGFVAAACDLTIPALLDAYGRGLVLRWIAGHPVWWSPERRVAGAPALAQEPQDALNLLASGEVRVTLDRQFDLVANKCTRRSILRARPFQPPRDGLALLARLHDAGFAHSVEIWNSKNKLVAGCYGIATGRAFITQAGFGSNRAAANLSLVMLNRHLAYWNYVFHDTGTTGCAEDFGLQVQSREDVQNCLAGSLAGDRRGRWLAAPELCQPPARKNT